MKLLFLRGQVPIDRDPKQIMFDDIDECDDVWTQLAYNLSKDGYGEVWYWGGSREVRYKDNFIERWISDFSITKYDFDPDIIFARGGFPAFDIVLNRFPKAYKIYYGAGKRYIPQTGFKDYDIIFNDTDTQIIKSSEKYNAKLFIKPAADNIFVPIPKDIEYDVIMIGNCRADDLKGINFALDRLPTNIKILHCGIADKTTIRKYNHVDFTNWIPRRELPKQYARAKIAIVCCKNVDSCPRVIPEALACNTPIVVLDRVNIWHDKYINKSTGVISTKNNFVDTVR